MLSAMGVTPPCGGAACLMASNQLWKPSLWQACWLSHRTPSGWALWKTLVSCHTMWIPSLGDLAPPSPNSCLEKCSITTSLSSGLPWEAALGRVQQAGSSLTILHSTHLTHRVTYLIHPTMAHQAPPWPVSWPRGAPWVSQEAQRTNQ